MHRLIQRLGHRAGLHFVAAVALVAAATAPGCGPRDPRLTIRGRVLLDGKPVSNGQVIFIPVDSTVAAAGAALHDGEFTIVVLQGPHRVKVEASAEERRTTAPDEPPEFAVTYRSIIPPRYNEKSTLSFDVQSAKDKPLFELTSEK
jgi:hypothetical protein